MKPERLKVNFGPYKPVSANRPPTPNSDKLAETGHSLFGSRQLILLKGRHDRRQATTRLIFMNFIFVVLHLVRMQRIAAGVLARACNANSATRLECHQRVQMPRPSI
jgi:hypothetical protein